MSKGVWGYCDNCWNYGYVEAASDPLQSNEKVEEIDLQTQLNVALQIMTQSQVDSWELQMKLIQKDCELMGARKRISDLEEKVNELTGVFSDAQD